MRGMLTPFSRPLVAALSMLVLVSGSGAAAASTRPPVTPTLRAVPGSALPALRGAARVAPHRGRSADRRDRVAEAAKRLAAGLQRPHLQRLEADDHGPAAHAVRAQPQPTGPPSSPTCAGTVCTWSAPACSRSASTAARPPPRAPSTSACPRYRGADGHVFRAPDAAVRLPAAISPLVSSVTGLDTATKLQSLATGPELDAAHRRPAPSCTGRGPCQAHLRRLPARRPGHRLRPPLPDRGRQRRQRRVDRAGRVLELQALRHLHRSSPASG